MPRNSSGAYTLPTGNPVASNTVIETAWANPTMADLGSAITDSLDRYGRGTMLAALKLIDGSAATPGLSFNSESSTGWFRPASHTLAASVAGVEMIRFTDTAVTLAKPLSLTGGLAITDNLTLPDDKAIIWGDASTFIRGNSVTDLITLGGVDVAAPKLHLAASNFGVLGVCDGGYSGVTPSGTYDGIVLEAAGTTGITISTPATGTPALVFANPNSVIAGFLQYIGGSDAMAFGTAGVVRLQLTATGLSFAAGVQVLTTAGSAALPAYAFAADTTSGMFRPTGGTLGWSVLGVEMMRLLNSSGESRLLLGQTAALQAAVGRGLVEVNGSTDSVVGLNAAGAKVGYIQGTSSSMRIGTVAAIPLGFYMNGQERMRLTEAGQSELLVGITSNAIWTSGNRGLVAIDGSAGSYLGMGYGGAARGNLQATINSINLNTYAGFPLLFSLGGTEIARIDTDSTLKYGGIEVGWRSLPSVAIGSAIALDATHRGKLIIFSAGNFNVPTGVFATGDIITCYNNTGGAFSIGGAVTMRWGAGTPLTGPRTLANSGLVTVTCISGAGNIFVLTGTGIS